MPTDNWHPTIKGEIEKIPERGPYSPWAYVTFEVDGHTHIVQLGDGKGGYNVLRDGEDIEAVADELVEAVQICSDSRHEDQHGKTHGIKHNADPKLIIEAAYRQLWNTDFDRQAAENHWLMAVFPKWGRKPVPAAVITPTEDGRDWQVGQPTIEGGAAVTPLRKGVIEDMPLPTPQTANKQLGFGWKSIQRESQDKKLRRVAYEQNGR